MAEDQPTEIPEVSIIIPVYNDELWVGRAIQSCLSQTLGNIEVIVVDDSSTDQTSAIARNFQAQDGRVSVVRQPRNLSAFQARRVGIERASAEFVMFLDGDDELVASACQKALALARTSRADVVGFGSTVITPDGQTGGRYEKTIQPAHRELFGSDIIASLFPVGKIAQGQLWRYLFSRELLLSAYDCLPKSLIVPRVNDLPIAFLALMNATHYVSTKERLYNYYFKRGASGHAVTTWEDYVFNASAIDSIEYIKSTVDDYSQEADGDCVIEEVYASTRSSIIARVLAYVDGIVDRDLQRRAIADLEQRVGFVALTVACVDFFTGALPLLARSITTPGMPSSVPSHVVLRTGNLRTGGVQGVLVAQAGYLARLGIRVTIALDSEIVTDFELPAGVALIRLEGATIGQRIQFLDEFCRLESVGAVIDHHVFYNKRWPYFALGASAGGVPTIGWIHNFALRPLVDGVTQLSFLEHYFHCLAQVVVLSEADVAYWKLRGVEHVAYLPNPASPLLQQIPIRSAPKTSPTESLRIIWWGRLQQATKQVLDLIEVGSILSNSGVEFHITIVGPDGPDLGARRVREQARRLGISSRVSLPGPLHGEHLIAEISKADVFVNTSTIEGYLLTLVEAQALGLPVLMYDLPWLDVVRENGGLITVPQGDRVGLARALEELLSAPDRFERLSSNSLEAADRVRSYDFEGLYRSLLEGRLDPKFSPEPTISLARLILDQNVRYVERQKRTLSREIRRLKDKVEEQAKTLRQVSSRPTESLVGVSARDRKAPDVPRVKRLLQRFLPPNMRQVAYYAKHEFNDSSVRHDQLVENQRILSAQIAQLEAQLSKRRR